MFVSRKRFDTLLRDYGALLLAYEALKVAYQQLNARHKEFRIAAVHGQQLDKETIKSMLVLCHPDKHDGKESAVRVTQKLLQLRQQL